MLSSPFGLRAFTKSVEFCNSASRRGGRSLGGNSFRHLGSSLFLLGQFCVDIQGFFSLQPLSSRAERLETKIVNAITHVLEIQHWNSVYRHLAFVPSNQEFIIHVDTKATYRKYKLVVGNQRILISSDDLVDAAEIRVYETPTQLLEFRVSKLRASKYQQAKGNIRDWTAFDAVKKDAASRMKIIENSHASLVMLSKQVKICPAQCQNFVQTCLEGAKEMKKAYNETFEDDMWQLYSSKKLGQLISSLDKLLSTLGSIQDLVQACGSNWCSMALVVSLPLRPPERMSSKFDILIKERHWNLETIHYALHLNRGVEFKSDERKFRYVLERIAGAEVTGDMELEQSKRLAFADREHLLSQLENGSILIPGNPLLYSLCWHLGFKFATDHLRDNFAAELQWRLKETSVLSNDYSSIPDCFWINNADLKLRSKLSGSRYASKSVWKGEWCGRAVAIGISKYISKAAVEKEAGLMLKVQHPNIVGFLGCAFTDDAPSLVRRENNENYSAGYLVMELMQEDLRHVIDRHARSRFGMQPFTLAVTVDILFQIAGAMVHMHNLDIMHRDLKSANCLVNLRSSSSSSSQVLKLIDFDRSKELDPNAPIAEHTAISGTRRWMAPEVWGVQISDANSSERPLVPYTRSADVWSFGMTCYEVITGLLPFDECRINTDIDKALKDGERPLIPASVSCPEGLKALMSRCWAQEPSDRPDFKDIEKDLWTIKFHLEIQ